MPPPMARMSLGCIRVWPLRGYSGLPSCSTGQRRELHGVRCRARRTWGCQLAVARCSASWLGIRRRPAATPRLQRSCRRLMPLRRAACWAAQCWMCPALSLAQSLDACGARHSLPAVAPMLSVMVTWQGVSSSPRSLQLAQTRLFLLQRPRGQTCSVKRSKSSCWQVCRAWLSVQHGACQLTPAAPWLNFRSEGKAAAPMPALAACLWRPGT
mmetsp:Transcript_47218/g.146310  ORF Transcript_47218/g.146310 Transcript_47218/m.146310 type:complete len:212 (+) Transcript_47218:448-1083(+)